MRKFYIINGVGETFALNSHRTAFLQKVTGLGWVQQTTYIKTGNAWIRDHGEDEQSAIAGELVFTAAGSNPYKKYADFNYWIRRSKDLVLVYETVAGTYYKDVDYISIAKEEISEGNNLICPVTFAAKSLWYKNDAENFAVNFSDTTSRFPLKFPVMFHDYSNGHVVVENDGSVDAGFTVEFMGPIVNPSIRLNTESGSKYFAVEAEAKSGESISYSSRDKEIYVFLKKADGTETNLFSCIELDNDNFFKIPVGTSEIELEAESDIVNPIYINVYKEYRTV